MALKMDRDVKRVTVVKSGDSSGARFVYRRRNDDDDDEQPIKRVTLIKRDEKGRILSHDVYGEERRGRRQSRSLQPAERGLRALMEFQGRVASNYLSRHDRSNEKSRDGWLSDMPRNVFRAVKQAKPKKLFSLKRIYRDRD